MKINYGCALFQRKNTNLSRAFVWWKKRDVSAVVMCTLTCTKPFVHKISITCFQTEVELTTNEILLSVLLIFSHSFCFTASLDTHEADNLLRHPSSNLASFPVLSHRMQHQSFLSVWRHVNKLLAATNQQCSNLETSFSRCKCNNYLFIDKKRFQEHSFWSIKQPNTVSGLAPAAYMGAL